MPKVGIPPATLLGAIAAGTFLWAVFIWAVYALLS